MSTLTQAQPGTAVRPRLLSVPLAVTFLAEFTTLTSFFLLLSVMPMLAAAAGTGSSAAGLITGSLLLGTVAAEAVATLAIRRFGSRMVLAAGAVLLGAPALAMLVREPEAVMVSVSLVRGFGFGLCGVVTGALTAKLLPAERRGEGLGLLGLVAGVPAIVALPAGIWLAGHHQAAAAAAMAATVGLLPLVAIRWLPGGRETWRTAGAGRQPAAQGSRRLAGAALRLPLIFAAATVAAGVLDSFLPIAKGIPSNLSSAALLVQAITATLSRWQAGKRGDRYGHARLLIPALAVAALGMAAMMVLGSPVVIFAGMALFGAGFGVIENATFALLIEQLPEAKASALWNLAYDAGYGAGPVGFGLICARTGYPAAFGLTSALILAALPAALRERKSGVAVVLREQVCALPLSCRAGEIPVICGRYMLRSMRYLCNFIINSDIGKGLT
jgi:predicted MFS family arabinose efflux permease